MRRKPDGPRAQPPCPSRTDHQEEPARSLHSHRRRRWRHFGNGSRTAPGHRRHPRLPDAAICGRFHATMNLQALLPYICLVVGICVFVSGIAIRKKLQSSESWPKTVGVIRESAVQPGFTRTGGSNFIYVVRPKVVYEYHVEGRKHTSSQL